MNCIGRNSQREAATLIELLAVTALIGTLIAVLLPAIQLAREAARRSACQNNLKQVNLALLQYDADHREFPMGAKCQRSAGFPSTTHGPSWWVDLLPYLEKTSLYWQIDRQGTSSGLVLLNARNGRLVDNVTIDTMLCPSSSIPAVWPVGNYRVMMPSYVGIAGASNDDGFPESRVSVCCAPQNNGQIASGGLLVSNRPIKWKEVTDGLSHTIVVGESSTYVLDSEGNQQRVDGGFPNGWLTGTRAQGTPSDYGDSISIPSWNITTIRYGVNVANYNLPGINNNRGPNNPLVSPHPGGINAGWIDGSVQFVSDDTDVALLKRLATRDDGGSP